METYREPEGGSSIVHEGARFSARLPVTASLCVGALLLVVGIGFARGSGPLYASNTSSALAETVRSSDLPSLPSVAESAGTMATSDLAMVGPAVVGALEAQYQQLQSSGSYTPEAAAAAAQQLGENISVPIPYKTYSVADITTSDDNSYAAMLAYRAQLKDALAPIAALKENELGIFAQYAQTKDPATLATLRAVAADYAAAAASSAEVVAPSDAAALHAGILNAMGYFGATLEALADNADDPITVITLLKTYNDAENAMVTSFNNLAQYYAHHPQP